MNNKLQNKSMFFRWVICPVVLLFIFIFSTDTIYAHVLKTHGSIGAVIHVSPEDDPIAGETTEFFFDLKDKNDKLKPDNCDCIGTVLQGGKEIYSAPVFQNGIKSSLESASFSFVFPEKDIYKVRVVGKPLTEGAFEPFTLEWDIRVARVTEKSQGSSTTKESDDKYSSVGWVTKNIPQTVVGLAIFVITIGALISRRRERK